MCLGLGVVLLILWTVPPEPRTRTGGLSVTFVGMTNDASGATLARLNFANAFTRRVELGVDEVQIRQTNGWPNWTRNAGGTNWFSVAAGSNLLVLVPAPSIEGATWRVPLTYQEHQPLGEESLDKSKALIGYGLAKLAGSPFQGIRRRPWSLKYGPELLWLSNQPPQAVLAKPQAEQSGLSQ